METSLGHWALLPLWCRLAMIYVAVALILATYLERRDAGDSVAEAIVTVVVAAVLSPVKFVVRLLTKPKA